MAEKIDLKVALQKAAVKKVDAESKYFKKSTEDGKNYTISHLPMQAKYLEQNAPQFCAKLVAINGGRVTMNALDQMLVLIVENPQVLELIK